MSSEIAGFNRALFGKVCREPKITNFNKTHPDKMPDIFFDLKREKMPVLSDQDGLFVECKPVDQKHPIWSCYCKKGLLRFIKGDYAWAMQEALMVGYVATNDSFVNFTKILDDSEKSVVLKTIEHTHNNRYEVFISLHKREFDWLDNHGRACSIAVSHLWLQV